MINAATIRSPLTDHQFDPSEERSNSSPIPAEKTGFQRAPSTRASRASKGFHHLGAQKPIIILDGIRIRRSWRAG